MILHNLKVALRNLMKYKLQTAISVLSIAIGIVTLAFAHAALSGATIPCLAGSLIVILLIAAIVVMHIHHIMRTNPSEIIAKE